MDLHWHDTGYGPMLKNHRKSMDHFTRIGDWYFMLYSGGTNNHGRKYPHSPVFKPTGNMEDFDGVFLQHACPVLVDGQWRLYYNGWTLNREAKKSLKTEYAIGLNFAKE
jgi:hypothetical protein